MRFPFSFARFAPFLAAAALVLSVARPAAAQAPPPLRIAVANPSRIFNEMQETKNLQAKMADDQKKFQATQQEKAAALKQLKESRDNLNPTHPQYEELNNQLMKASLEYKVWIESQKLTAEYAQKKQMKALFEKVQAAIAEVAKRDGIDIVIADNKEPLPTEAELEQINLQALRQVIIQKDVLYASDRSDISQTVMALLDARYKVPGAAAVTPAGAGTAAPLVNPAGQNK